MDMTTTITTIDRSDRIDRIETSFHEKIFLYRELVETLKQEKAVLLESNVDGLWKISDRKQALATEIEKLRARILSELKEAGVAHEMQIKTFRMSEICALLPEPVKSRMEKIKVTLFALKDEIFGLVTHNKRFVSEYLKFLDELYGFISHARQAESGYGNMRYSGFKNNTNNLLLHREA